MKNKILKAVRFGLAALFFLVALGTVVYFVLGPAEGYFHSDSTDTIFWAEASFLSGRVFDPAFNYAAMLPFGGELLMLVWMPFFGTSMTTQALGMISFLVVLAAALMFFFRSWRFSWTNAFFWTAAILLTLSATDKLREMFWGHVIYYSLYVVFLLVGFGLLARLRTAEPIRSKRNVATLAILFVFLFLVALDGLQLVFIFTVPLAAGIVLERWFDLKKKLFTKENLGIGIVLAVVVVATIAGLATLSLLKGDQRAGYADAWYGMTPIDEWLVHLEAIPEHWITLLGGGVPTDAANRFDVLEKMFSLGFALFLAVFPLVSLFLYKKTDDPLLRVFTIQHFILVVLLFLGVVFGSLGAANWRWIPVIASGLLLSILTLRTIAERLGGIRWTNVIAPVLVLFAGVNAVEILKMPADYGRDNQVHELAAELESRGLTYGYADFWFAQAITVVSDGAVKVRSVNYSADEGIVPYYYQSSFAWYEEQAGVSQYFILLSTWDYNLLHASDKYDEIAPHWVETIQAGSYYIIVFDENVF